MDPMLMIEPPPATAHPRVEGLGEENGCLEVDGQSLLDLSGGLVLRLHPAGQEGGVVHEDVHPPTERLEAGPCRIGDLIMLLQIDVHRDQLSERRRREVELGGTSRHGYHLGSGHHEGSGQAGSDAGAGPGDHCRLPFEAEQICNFIHVIGHFLSRERTIECGRRPLYFPLDAR